LCNSEERQVVVDRDNLQQGKESEKRNKIIQEVGKVCTAKEK